MKKPLLSISIPTYNRSKELLEIVNQYLAINSDDIEVVVTDNHSSDNTIKLLKKITDYRLKIFENEKKIPAYYNMIISLFNASGKYVIHCNDRDKLINNNLLTLINFLKTNDDFSFILTSNISSDNTNLYKIYKQGFDSIIHLGYTHHPTGMVFNNELMKKKLKKEEYLKYVPFAYTSSFLMRDLIIYDRTAFYDFAVWEERKKFKAKNRAGTAEKGYIYFEINERCEQMNSILNHLLFNDYYFKFTNPQKEAITIDIINKFFQKIALKKIYYSSNEECKHYGINKKYIYFKEYKKDYQQFFNTCDNFIEKYNFSEKMKENYIKIKRKKMKYLIFDYIKCECIILKKKILGE